MGVFELHIHLLFEPFKCPFVEGYQQTLNKESLFVSKIKIYIKVVVCIIFVRAVMKFGLLIVIK